MLPVLTYQQGFRTGAVAWPFFDQRDQELLKIRPQNDNRNSLFAYRLGSQRHHNIQSRFSTLVQEQVTALYAVGSQGNWQQRLGNAGSLRCSPNASRVGPPYPAAEQTHNYKHFEQHPAGCG